MDIHVVIVHNDLPKRWSNHCYEVHPIGGEIEETHHVVIVHKDLILVFSLLLS